MARGRGLEAIQAHVLLGGIEDVQAGCGTRCSVQCTSEDIGGSVASARCMHLPACYFTHRACMTLARVLATIDAVARSGPRLPRACHDHARASGCAAAQGVRHEQGPTHGEAGAAPQAARDQVFRERLELQRRKLDAGAQLQAQAASLAQEQAAFQAQAQAAAPAGPAPSLPLAHGAPMPAAGSEQLPVSGVPGAHHT